MHDIKSLQYLQETDVKIQELETKLNELSARLDDDSEISDATANLNRVTEEVDIAIRKRSDAEDSMVIMQKRLTVIETKLYSGGINSPREMGAAEQERVFVSQQIKDKEDELIELMVEAEDAETGRSDAEDDLAGLVTDKPALDADLRESQLELDVELVEHRKRRDELSSNIEADLITLYESKRMGTNGTPVAKVERDMCQGCRMTLSTMDLQRVKNSVNPVTCNSCNRILYVP